ncbi:uncharacterized protein LOC6030956 [Culex quinquefasciatus]|uniref:uncharacterized protein LOC6030956 n=1 Tax=Culex quinquefasciatus TaxID=7176 RepID=UPI0018E3E1B0|nr:uncharacterized protein LOC6030956 [Culex quinquefasciatus]
MGLFPDPPLTPKLKNKLFRSSSSRKANNSKASAVLSDRKCTDSSSSSSDFVTVTTAHQLSTSWEFIRSASSDNDTDKESPTEGTFPPHYTEIYKPDRECTGAEAFLPPRYIEVRKGRIILETKRANGANDETNSNECLSRIFSRPSDNLSDYERPIAVHSNPETPTCESRILGTFGTKNTKQLDSPTLETKISEPSAIINNVKQSSTQSFYEHKTIEACFQRQEESLLMLQQENKSLHQRVEQYEACLDDIMRKVVDALVAEDNLREEVSILKNRVKDLEAQNAILIASPARSRDEGYCTMSSGLPQFTQKSHLEELPEEPEQWLVAAEPCSAEIEDWSMSQEELATALEVEGHDWIWNTNFLATMATQSEDVPALLQETILYSDDEEVACTNFTRDFYRLVSIKSESNQSLQSPTTVETTTSSNSDKTERLTSEYTCTETNSLPSARSRDATVQQFKLPSPTTTVPSPSAKFDVPQQMPARSNGWKRNPRKNQETFIPVPINSKDRQKSLPPVPVRRHFTS